MGTEEEDTGIVHPIWVSVAEHVAFLLSRFEVRQESIRALEGQVSESAGNK